MKISLKMFFPNFYFQTLLIFVSIISLTNGSFEEFCELKQFKSVFNIDKHIYFVVSQNNDNIFWRYDTELNEMVVDKQMKSIVKQIQFDANHPIIGFKLTEVYECSKDPINCKDPNYKFDDIMCKDNASYCQQMAQLQGNIFLFGFDSQQKQFYQTLRSDSNGFQFIDDNKMTLGLKAKDFLTNKTFLAIDGTKEMLVSIAYFKPEYPELIMLIKSETKLVLRVAFLKYGRWFEQGRIRQYYDSTNDLKESIGFIQKDLNVFAIDSTENSLYLYVKRGAQDLRRMFQKENKNLKSLFNCSDVITTLFPDISTTESGDTSFSEAITAPQSGVTTTTNPVIFSPNSDYEESEIPETDPWLLLIIPIVIVILVVVSGIIAYFWFLRPKEKSESTKHKPQNKDIQNVINRDSNL